MTIMSATLTAKKFKTAKFKKFKKTKLYILILTKYYQKLFSVPAYCLAHDLNYVNDTGALACEIHPIKMTP